MAARRARKKINAENISDRVIDFVKMIKTDIDRLEFTDINLSQSIEEQKETNHDAKLLTKAADDLNELASLLDGLYVQRVSETRTEAVTDVLDSDNLSDEDKLKMLAEKIFGISDLKELHKDGSVESPKEVVEPDIKNSKDSTSGDAHEVKKEVKPDVKAGNTFDKSSVSGSSNVTKPISKPAPISGSGSISHGSNKQNNRPTFTPNNGSSSFPKGGSSSF